MSLQAQLLQQTPLAHQPETSSPLPSAGAEPPIPSWEVPTTNVFSHSVGQEPWTEVAAGSVPPEAVRESLPHLSLASRASRPPPAPLGLWSIITPLPSLRTGPSRAGVCPRPPGEGLGGKWKGRPESGNSGATQALSVSATLSVGMVSTAVGREGVWDSRPSLPCFLQSL